MVKRVLRGFALIWVRAPVAGVLGVVTVAVLVVWAATSARPITLIRPNPSGPDTVEVSAGEGEIRVWRCVWQQAPSAPKREDWSFGSWWLGLGIWLMYAGSDLGADIWVYYARVPLWLLVLLFGAYPAVKAFRYWQWWRRRPVVWCKRCRYDLTGNVSGVCPECGTPVADERRR